MIRAMVRISCTTLGILAGIPILSFALFVGLVVFVSVYDLFEDEPRLEYMFDDDDPTAIVPVSFPLSEIAARLDASGHRHGGVAGTLPRDVYDVMLDNDCKRAWFRASAPDPLRIVGLEATGACNDTGSREELMSLFRDDFVPRLEGRLPPLAYQTSIGGEFYTYPRGSEPTLLLTGSLVSAQERFDDTWYFEHEVHDGVYYLSELACFGRFRLEEDRASNEVRVIGVGYARPCRWGNDACLERTFSWLIRQAGDPTPGSTPGSTHALAASPTPCPFP
jgi:hypothetical protein